MDILNIFQLMKPINGFQPNVILVLFLPLHVHPITCAQRNRLASFCYSWGVLTYMCSRKAVNGSVNGAF